MLISPLAVRGGGLLLFCAFKLNNDVFILNLNFKNIKPTLKGDCGRGVNSAANDESCDNPNAGVTELFSSSAGGSGVDEGVNASSCSASSSVPMFVTLPS